MSVIIPARGSAAPLALCLEALRRQSLPATHREIIIVDNGLTGIRTLCERYPEVKLVREEGIGSYAARNRGLAEAKGEFVAFTDADCLPSPEWLESAIAALKTTDATLVGGQIAFAEAGQPRLNCYERLEQRILDAARQRRRIEEQGFAVTANLVAYRCLFERVGLFDSELRSSGDREWTQRAVARGETLRYCEGALVLHPRRRTFASICRKLVRLRGGMMALARKRGFRTDPSLLRRFTLLDPAMYGSAIACSHGRGFATRLFFFGAVMFMAVAATVESLRVLGGAKGYRG